MICNVICIHSDVAIWDTGLATWSMCVLITKMNFTYNGAYLYHVTVGIKAVMNMCIKVLANLYCLSRKILVLHSP